MPNSDLCLETGPVANTECGAGTLSPERYKSLMAHQSSSRPSELSAFRATRARRRHCRQCAVLVVDACRGYSDLAQPEQAPADCLTLARGRTILREKIKCSYCRSGSLAENARRRTERSTDKFHQVSWAENRGLCTNFRSSILPCCMALSSWMWRPGGAAVWAPFAYVASGRPRCKLLCP